MNKDLMNRDYLDSINVDTIYIIGPGPNGKKYWKSIPKDSTCIFLNKAIEIYHEDIIKCSTAYWIVCEPSVLDTDWFNTYKEEYKDILIAGKAVIKVGKLKEEEYFKSFSYHNKIAIVDNALSIGTTIAGIAIQMSYHIQALNITLCGVDMFSDIYFDGTKGGYTGREDKPWLMTIERIDRLINIMKTHRTVEIQSISPTSLRIPLKRGK